MAILLCSLMKVTCGWELCVSETAFRVTIPNSYKAHLHTMANWNFWNLQDFDLVTDGQTGSKLRLMGNISGEKMSHDQHPPPTPTIFGGGLLFKGDRSGSRNPPLTDWAGPAPPGSPVQCSMCAAFKRLSQHVCLHASFVCVGKTERWKEGRKK